MCRPLLALPVPRISSCLSTADWVPSSHAQCRARSGAKPMIAKPESPNENTAGGCGVATILRHCPHHAASCAVGRSSGHANGGTMTKAPTRARSEKIVVAPIRQLESGAPVDRFDDVLALIGEAKRRAFHRSAVEPPQAMARANRDRREKYNPKIRHGRCDESGALETTVPARKHR